MMKKSCLVLILCLIAALCFVGCKEPLKAKEKFELPENFDPCGDSRYISVSDDSDAEDDINDADVVLEEDDVNVVVSKSLKKSAEIEVEAVEDFFE